MSTYKTSHNVFAILGEIGILTLLVQFIFQSFYFFIFNLILFVIIIAYGFYERKLIEDLELNSDFKQIKYFILNKKGRNFYSFLIGFLLVALVVFIIHISQLWIILTLWNIFIFLNQLKFFSFFKPPIFYNKEYILLSKRNYISIIYFKEIKKITTKKENLYIEMLSGKFRKFRYPLNSIKEISEVIESEMS
jgi:hypothetical protein